MRRLLRCPQCYDDRQHVVAEKDRYGESITTVCCEGCGLLYTQNPLDRDSLVRFYAFFYRELYETAVDHDTVKGRFAGVRRVMGNKARKFTEFLGLSPDNDMVIEIGCGGGWNLAPFADLGFRVAGYDYGKDFIAFGRAEGIEIHDSSETDPTIETPDAALCLVMDVLEHVEDPFEFLANINRYLRDGGYLYVAVPSLPDIPFGYAGGSPLGTLQNAHLFLFDRFTLATYLEQAGFEIVFLRHNMTALACKVRAPIRSPHKIPGNYQRNMRTLRWSERVTRLYWTWIAFVLSGAKRHGGFEPYHKIRMLHALVLSRARRNEFFHRRRVTGY